MCMYLCVMWVGVQERLVSAITRVWEIEDNFRLWWCLWVHMLISWSLSLVCCCACLDSWSLSFLGLSWFCFLFFIRSSGITNTHISESGFTWVLGFELKSSWLPSVDDKRKNHLAKFSIHLFCDYFLWTKIFSPKWRREAHKTQTKSTSLKKFLKLTGFTSYIAHNFPWFYKQ